MNLSNPAIIGALVGLVIGLVEYFTVLRVIGRALDREGAQGGEMPGLDAARGRMVAIRRGLAVMSFLFMPAIGYLVGATFAGPEMRP